MKYLLVKESRAARILKQKIHILVVTWNMNGQEPLNNLKELDVFKNSINFLDVIVIGTQESYTYNINRWTRMMKSVVGQSYVLKKKKQLGKLQLMLFLHHELLNISSIPRTDVILLDKLSIFRSKGAISFTLKIYESQFSFTTVHLAPHQCNVKKRIKGLRKIINFLNSEEDFSASCQHKGASKNYDVAFIFGDMNFRISRPREKVMSWIKNTHFSNRRPAVLEGDQLLNLKNDPTLMNFLEAPITFPPTYKYNQGDQTFDSSKKRRTPSYTDRIIYLVKSENSSEKSSLPENSMSAQTKCLVYDSIRNICSSDHKPVYGIFSTTIRARI